MPEVTVAAGGRIFKAFGNIAHKANQNAVLNQLYCINAYNGTILWTRDLSPGYMIHRNTMIATPDILYLADDKSCKLIDTSTGKVQDEIVVPADLSDGSVWKWMALDQGVLYGLVGGSEIHVDTITSDVRGIGHWPWGMWKGHDYSDPRTNFGFGRTFLAIDPHTKEILWHYRDDQYIDSRGVCMGNDRIYFYSPEKFLACISCAGWFTIVEEHRSVAIASDWSQRSGTALRHGLQHDSLYQVPRQAALLCRSTKKPVCRRLGG